MGAIVIAINAVLRFITGAKVLSFSFFTWISSNFITFFFAFQFITWIASAIFTLMLGFYGTEIISSVLDVTGVQTYVSSLLSNVFDLAVLLITVQLIMLLAQLWMMHFCISTSMIFSIY